MHQTSPGVERAVAAAQVWAERLGSPQVRLVDYLLGLLDEEEGRPAVLLERYGHSVAEVREVLAALTHAPEASVQKLFDAARDWSIAHRADPVFLTDALLVSVLQADPAFWRAVPPFEQLAHQIASSFRREDRPTLGVELQGMWLRSVRRARRHLHLLPLRLPRRCGDL